MPVDSQPVPKPLTQTPSATAAASPSLPQAHDCSCPKRVLPPPIPDKLPYPATKENRGKLQEWLLNYYASSTFNVCEHQQLPFMNTVALKFMIDPNAKPVAKTKPRPIPIHLQDRVKALLDRFVRLGSLRKAPFNVPVPWCHDLVITEKKDGTLRLTVDLQNLNAYAERELHHTQSPFHQARIIPSNMKKTVSDAWNGYHSLPIREEDRHYTRFCTPWGVYEFTCATQGYTASGDGYTKRFDEIVRDIPNKTKCIDDACLWAPDLTESFFQACQWLDTCGRNGIIQNPVKFVFGADEVEFAGFQITLDSVRPCDKYFSAIANFPTPRNRMDVRSWFGLINQVSYAFSMASIMLPFRELLKDIPFYWNEELEELFKKSKQQIIKEIEHGVTIFDKDRTTCLATDWSKTGVGYSLFQKHCACPAKRPFCCPSGWKLTLVGSRFTKPAETRYAPIEGESLAIAEALNKARYFVLGCKDLIVATDHKPLLNIFNNRALNDIDNDRVLKFKEKTLKFRFSIVHIPGKKHTTADALSRYPTNDGSDEAACLSTTDGRIFAPINHLLAGIRSMETVEETVDDDLRFAAVSALGEAKIQAVNWDRVRVATNSDEDMRRLVELVETGVPSQRHDWPPALRQYYQFRDHLYTVDGVPIYKSRVIIPPSLRQEILSSLHAAHQGVTQMLARAETSFFWPGMTPEITSLRENCYDCNRNAPSQPHPPPTPPISPSYPFQCICSDFFHHIGQYYFVTVDRYSNWPQVERVAKGGAENLIDSLRRMFSTYGIPDELSSDGGPEFKASVTEQFLHNWGVSHRMSSVGYPHSNCRAELGVKTVKRMILNNTGPDGNLNVDAFQRAILQYRNTPDQHTSLSPAMILFGRPIKDFIPILPGAYRPHNTWRELLHDREIALRNRHQKACERLTEHTKRLPPLVIGDYVRLQNQIGNNPRKWDRTGKVIEVKQFDQYVVRVDGSGRQTTRNRQFLRKYTPAISSDPRKSPTPTPANQQGIPEQKTASPNKSVVGTYQSPQWKQQAPGASNKEQSTTGGNSKTLELDEFPTIRPVERKTQTSPDPTSSPPMTSQDQPKHQEVEKPPPPSPQQQQQQHQSPSSLPHQPEIEPPTKTTTPPPLPTRKSTRIKQQPVRFKDYVIE